MDDTIQDNRPQPNSKVLWCHGVALEQVGLKYGEMDSIKRGREAQARAKEMEARASRQTPRSSQTKGALTLTPTLRLALAV